MVSDSLSTLLLAALVCGTVMNRHVAVGTGMTTRKTCRYCAFPVGWSPRARGWCSWIAEVAHFNRTRGPGDRNTQFGLGLVGGAQFLITDIAQCGCIEVG